MWPIWAQPKMASVNSQEDDTIMHSGAVLMTTPIKSISAAKPSRGSGQTRAKKKRGGENVLWKRVTANFDEAVKKFAASPEIATPITRLVFFKHLTVKQGMAGRRYADIVGRFERYHVDKSQRTARSQSFEPVRGGEDQEVQRRILDGTISEYEAEGRKAKREYNRMKKVLDRYADPVTGRNVAKNVLDDLCLSQIEPPAQYRANLASVLEAMANEFAVRDKR